MTGCKKRNINAKRRCKMKKLLSAIKKDDEYCWGRLEFLSETAQNMIVEYLENEVTNIQIATSECESPIEEMMALALYRQKFDFCEDFFVTPQEVINTTNNEYRVDFLVEIIVKNRFKLSFVIECDGHEYHETKEQAKKDRQKDRDLLGHGYRVFRFTGSEIYNDPLGCAREVHQHIKIISEAVFNQSFKK